MLTVPPTHDREHAKLALRNSQRFKWHEEVVTDHRALTPSAILFAGLVMHNYSAKDGYATVSMRAVSRRLRIMRSTAQSAAGLLVERGWLYRMNPTNPVAGTRNPSARFALGDGPGDGLRPKAIGSRPEGHDGLGAKATSSVRVSDSLPCKESSKEEQNSKSAGDPSPLVVAIMAAKGCDRAKAEAIFRELPPS